MSWFLLSLFIVVIIAIMIGWYMTRGYREIQDDVVINLATDENRLLETWFEYNIKPPTEEISNEELASQILYRHFKLDIEPKYLILGEDLDQEYKNITRKKLSEDIEKIKEGGDGYIDLRPLIGKNCQIAIIKNTRIVRKIRNNVIFDSGEINSMIYQELDVLARDYLQKVLHDRWNKINEIMDPHIINRGGSYLYLHECQIPNIETMMIDNQHRLNLLCTNLEFETLIRRWQHSLLQLQ